MMQAALISTYNQQWRVRDEPPVQLNNMNEFLARDGKTIKIRQILPVKWSEYEFLVFYEEIPSVSTKETNRFAEVEVV